MAYTTAARVKLVLRAAEGAKSWADGDFDDIIGSLLAEADTRINALCPDWAPFTAGVTEPREFVADAASRALDVLTTAPYTAAPTNVTVDGTDVGFAWKPWIAPVGGSGRGLEAVTPHRSGDRSAGTWREGVTYTVTASWGWASVPDGVTLAATRIAAKGFEALRNPVGIVQIPGVAMYEPRYDPQVNAWLRPWLRSLE